ncbi:Transposon TX1 uncharacterized 149 kDa protein [Linum perenne]
MLRSIAQAETSPWCVIGDFNDIVDASECRGPNPRPQAWIEGFRAAVDDCNIVDVPMHGYQFTWARAKGEVHGVESRLDRAMVNRGWSEIFPHAQLHNGVAPISDHSPIILTTTPTNMVRHRWRFRFEEQWKRDPELKPLVESEWRAGGRGSVFNKLEGCAERLGRWGQMKARRFKERIKGKKEQLEHLRNDNSQGAAEEAKKINQELLIVLQEEEDFWRQRAKQFWLKDGDSNTRYFHAVANGRRKKKRIDYLLDEADRIVTEEADIGEVVRRYFENIFTTAGSNHVPVTNVIDGRITEEDNRRLHAPFTKEEFKEALFTMEANKAPGPDGFNPGFYQYFWDLIGDDIYEAGKGWLERGEIPVEAQDTNIVLLPKVDDPKAVKDWRPISLCNVLYRVVAKVLANRLRGVVEELISPEQAAFIKGRSIMDNIMIAFETLHTMKLRRSAKEAEMAVKIDISKAYDRVEWPYLEAVMRKMRFGERWVRWMMMCVRSVSYHVVVNDNQVGPITPTRGLRQGCPLSPFLFILCAEGLSALLKDAARKGEIHGVAVRHRAPKVNHLLFADDSFFFVKAEIAEARKLKTILATYAAASGQLINYQKSGIMFSSNADTLLRQGLSNIMGIFEPLDTGRYLGLPSCVGRSKRVIFSQLKDRIWSRLQGWRGKKISKAGKEVLIKAVVQSMPVYHMNVFLLTKTVAEEIERMINSFWWGTKGIGGGGIAWMRWERLSVAKDGGGMGFRNLMEFNKAMLGKQGWKLFTNPNTLVSRVYKAKYYPKEDFLRAKEGHNPSFVWKSIRESQTIVGQGFRWRLGNGRSVGIWKEPWLREEGNCRVETEAEEGLEHWKVSDLAATDGRSWDDEIVRSVFVDRDIDAILKLRPLRPDMEDRVIWRWSLNGEYTVRSAYHALMQARPTMEELRVDGDWRKLWNIDVPPKMRHLMWRIARNVVPTRHAIMHRGIPGVEDKCGLCGNGYETVEHLFLDCEVARRCWQVAGADEVLPPGVSESNTWTNWYMKVIRDGSTETQRKVAIVTWALWKERNDRVWNQTSKPEEVCIRQSTDAVMDWVSMQGRGLCPRRREEGRCDRWHRPPPTYVKINCDAAINVRGQSFGIGVVIRDEEGNLVGFKMENRIGCPPVKECEAEAVVCALHWANELGIRRALVETDSQVTQLAMESNGNSTTEFGNIISQGRSLLRSQPRTKVVFVRRSGNTVAHVLARRSLFSSDTVIGSEAPDWLRETLMDVCVMRH